MTYLLVAFLAVLIAPLLVATWRTSLLGLGLQGVLMTAIALERGWEPTPAGIVLLADLLLLRGYVVPRYLYGILRRQETPRRTDVIPANLFSWTLAGALVLLSFRFADARNSGGRSTGSAGRGACSKMRCVSMRATSRREVNASMATSRRWLASLTPTCTRKSCCPATW